MKIEKIDIGPQSKSDTAFTAKYRLIQSQYRANELKEECGFGPNKNSQDKYGNMLLKGEITGSNFISKEAFRFAKQKVLDKQLNKYMTIEEFRLFNNMLSSMPMCFNMFSDLRVMLLTDQVEVTRIIKTMFRELEWIKKVTYIDIEFIPVPISDYTNDKSAFDAMILVEDENGKKGVISIETKYTDLLGSNTASNSETKNNILDKYRLFDSELTDYLKEHGYQQIHRNYLLTFIFAKINKFNYFANVVISPDDDKLSLQEINQLRKHLVKDNNSILKISLETIINRGIESENPLIHEVYTEFQKRYF